MYSISDLKKNDSRQFVVSIYKTNSNHVMKRKHSHQHYEIINIQSQNTSNQFFEIDNRKYNFTNNDFMLIPPNVRHKLIRERKNSTRLLINFTEDLAKEIFDFLEIDIDIFFEINIIELTSAQTKEIYNIASELSDFNNPATPQDIALRKAKIVLAKILENIYFFKGKPVKQLIYDEDTDIMIDYIKANFRQEINLDHLAKKFFMSKYQLCREIRKKTGSSYTEFITDLRLNEACRLLENTDLSVTAIAHDAGFNSPSYFSVLFKENKNLSPKEYRKIYKK